MRGRKLNIQWHEDEATLKRLYLEEGEPELRTRFHALWLIRQGYSVTEVAKIVGVHIRTVQRWLAWYRGGGIEGLRRHRRGGRQGRQSYLTPEQCTQLLEQARQGGFRTISEAVVWVKEQFDVSYTYWGMRSLFRRLKLVKKVPRPLAAKASLQAQEAWKKGAWWLPFGNRG